ncbi:hypothetical protein [Sporosarcina sp. Marseille-Q4943]|uniref:hypothetical protein n=1 Tax=Sporosarcina sp. Marseille-Q4943 TaxID=2942204 RepID=UPI00208DB306|nr:hypothetical protein [Sporosarcina sp. Marseille-Q4943]
MSSETKSITSDVISFKTYKAKKIVDDKPNVWVAVGKMTPWTEANPETVPDVSMNDTVQEIVGMKRADLVHYVVPDENGTVEQYGQNWRIIDEAEAIEKNCKWVYVQAWLSYDNFPVVTYRQTGVYILSEMVPGTPVNKQIVLPNEIVNNGFCCVVNNRNPMPRHSTQKESVEFIIEL